MHLAGYFRLALAFYRYEASDHADLVVGQGLGFGRGERQELTSYEFDSNGLSRESIGYGVRRRGQHFRSKDFVRNQDSQGLQCWEGWSILLRDRLNGDFLRGYRLYRSSSYDDIRGRVRMFPVRPVRFVVRETDAAASVTCLTPEAFAAICACRNLAGRSRSLQRRVRPLLCTWPESRYGRKRFCGHWFGPFLSDGQEVTIRMVRLIECTVRQLGPPLPIGGQVHPGAVALTLPGTMVLGRRDQSYGLVIEGAYRDRLNPGPKAVILGWCGRIGKVPPLLVEDIINMYWIGSHCDLLLDLGSFVPVSTESISPMRIFVNEKYGRYCIFAFFTR